MREYICAFEAFPTLFTAIWNIILMFQSYCKIDDAYKYKIEYEITRQNAGKFQKINWNSGNR